MVSPKLPNFALKTHSFPKKFDRNINFFTLQILTNAFSKGINSGATGDSTIQVKNATR